MLAKYNSWVRSWKAWNAAGCPSDCLDWPFIVHYYRNPMNTQSAAYSLMTQIAKGLK